MSRKFRLPESRCAASIAASACCSLSIVFSFMQWSVHAPSPYLCAHRAQLLPTWTCPIASVLVVLQPFSGELLHRSPQIERQKQRLRRQFLDLSYRLATALQAQGYLAEAFDPRTGWPLLSPPGQVPLDDVAIVRSCLGYPTVNRQGCSVLLHPVWGSSVYPSTLLSSASLPQLAHCAAQQFGAEENTIVSGAPAKTGSRH